MKPIQVRLDRIQIVSWAPQGKRPPLLQGYKLVSDWFVRCQTTTATYAPDRIRGIGRLWRNWPQSRRLINEFRHGRPTHGDR